MSLLSTQPQTLSTDPRIGASQASAALGLNPYQAPIDVWLEKTGRSEAFQGNETTFWGQALEPLIRAHYVEKNNVTVFVPPTTIKHATIPFISATPDGIVINEAHEWQYVAPQVKNVGLRMAGEWEDVPTYYVVQAVVEMAVCNLPRLDFAVLIGGQEYAERTVHRDLDVEAAVIEGLQDFWRLVEQDIEPPIDGSLSYKRHLMAKIRRAGILEAQASDREHMAAWRKLVVEIEKLEEQEQLHRNHLLKSLADRGGHAIKDAELGIVSLSAESTSTSWKSVAEACGCPADIIALHTKAAARKFNRPRNWSKS